MEQQVVRVGETLTNLEDVLLILRDGSESEAVALLEELRSMGDDIQSWARNVVRSRGMEGGEEAIQ